MNNENLGSQQYNRQNQLIDVLLNENQYLKQIISTFLLQGKEMGEEEIARLQLIVGNNETDISRDQLAPGNFASEVSTGKLTPGNLQMEVSSGKLVPGNNEMKVSSYQVDSDLFAQQYGVVLQNIAPLMLTAGKRAVQNTAKMIVQLRHNAATPLHELRKLTGMSNDGMSKRIMAMKKAGLITRVSAPKRYLLTGKALELFEEKRR